MQKGYTHIYTGNGKGKTTAAIGLAIRAVGAGKKVFIAQFVKGMLYNEIKAIQKYLPTIEVQLYGQSCFIDRAPNEQDIAAAKHGLAEVQNKMLSNTFDVIILDEINIALYFKLLSVEEVLALIAQKPKHTELIMTGRYAPEALIEKADLVTDMREVKHYYQQGVLSRLGIDV